jgi:hypothetical protein
VPEWWTSHENELGKYIRNHCIYGDGFTQLADDLINYRWLTDTVGYVSVLQMAGFGEDTPSERANVEAAIDQVVAEFADAEAVIIGVRFNGGGYDAIALTLAGRFADQERLAFTKQTRNGDDFTPPDSYYVTPGGPQQYTGQVIVLTSSLTASAAEIFFAGDAGLSSCNDHRRTDFRRIFRYPGTYPAERLDIRSLESGVLYQ